MPARRLCLTTRSSASCQRWSAESVSTSASCCICRQRRFLGMRLALDEARLLALWPHARHATRCASSSMACGVSARATATLAPSHGSRRRSGFTGSSRPAARSSSPRPHTLASAPTPPPCSMNCWRAWSHCRLASDRARAAHACHPHARSRRIVKKELAMTSAELPNGYASRALRTTTSMNLPRCSSHMIRPALARRAGSRQRRVSGSSRSGRRQASMCSAMRRLSSRHQARLRAISPSGVPMTRRAISSRRRACRRATSRWDSMCSCCAGPNR